MASAGGSGPLFAERLDRRAVDELHHDKAFRAPADKVVNSDDVRMLHRRQELPLGHRRGCGRLILGVQQALEHHPAIQHVVFAEVQPTQSAEGKASLDLVLVGHDIAGLERGNEGIRRSAGWTKARLAASQSRRVTLGIVAVGIATEPPVRWHLGVSHDHLFGIDCWQLGHGHHSQPEVFPRAGPGTAGISPRGTGAQASGRWPRARSRTAQRRRTRPEQAGGPSRGGAAVGRFQPAAVAESAFNCSAAARLGASPPSISIAPLQ